MRSDYRPALAQAQAQLTLKLLAVHILGEKATELVHIGQGIIDHGGTVEYLRDVVFNYPTLAEVQNCGTERLEPGPTSTVPIDAYQSRPYRG